MALVLLMVLVQGSYALFAFIDPGAFSSNRGTELADVGDSDWVRIYASRTLFVALIVGYLLYARDFVLLKWVALLGLVMPVADALLAHQSDAAFTVVAKHLATVVYLMCTFLVLGRVAKKQAPRSASGESER
jgi:hypothetical protein